MTKRYYVGRCSISLEVEINRIIKVIRKKFGIRISKYQASKIIAYKNRNSNVFLDDKKLLQILGENE